MVPRIQKISTHLSISFNHQQVLDTTHDVQFIFSEHGNDLLYCHQQLNEGITDIYNGRIDFLYHPFFIWNMRELIIYSAEKKYEIIVEITNKHNMIMKKLAFLGMGLCVALTYSSCKSTKN